MPQSLLQAVALAAVLVLGSARAADEAGEQFAAGSRAFEAGDYARALELFEAALDAGHGGPSILYNIGVTEYRLGRYDDAAATFADLEQRFPAFHDVAEYNRGLALLGAGREAGAREAFARAERGTDEKIAALARTQLARLGATVASARPAYWQAYAEALLGHDDNVALVDELSLPANFSASSSLAELLGVATRTFAAAPLTLEATGYAVHHLDASEYDQSQLRIALSGQWSVGAWALSAGPAYGMSTLDGDGFERWLGAAARARRALPRDWTLDTRLLYDDLDAATQRFAAIAGTRTLLRVALEHRMASARLRLTVDRESNDRDDPIVSPDRLRMSVTYRRPLSAEWFIDGTLAWRDSRYADPDAPRNEDLFQAIVGLRRDLPIGWTLSIEGRFADNDSTRAAYSYDSRRIGIALGRGFDRRVD